MNGIGTFRTGEPFTGRVGSNRSANGDRWSPDRPNLNPGFSNDPTRGVTAGCAGVAAGQAADVRGDQAQRRLGRLGVAGVLHRGTLGDRYRVVTELTGLGPGGSNTATRLVQSTRDGHGDDWS